jgi:hypothetical protein
VWLARILAMSGLFKGSGLRIAIAILAAMAVFGGAGASSASGPISAPLIAYWDGTSWTQQAAPNPDSSATLTAVAAVSPTDAWALGSYGYSTSAPSAQWFNALAEHWDGSSWQQVAIPTPPGASGVHISGTAAVSSTDIWAVGSWADFGAGDGLVPLIEHWDGSAWSIVPSPVLPHPVANQGAQLYGVTAVSGTDVWAVGYIGTGTHHNLILHWDGTSWSRVPTPHMGSLTSLSGVTAISATKIWAVGTTHIKLGKHLITVPFALRWNGKIWQRMPNLGAGSLLAVTGSENNIWAVGYWRSGNYDFGSACGNCHALPLIEHWNGKHWKTFPARTSNTQSVHQPLTSVVMLTGNELWAVGYHEDEHSLQSQTLIEHFDHGAWSPVGSMNPAKNDSFASAAAATPTAVWAVGTYFPGS